jgi:hypothetical protein
MPIHCETVTRTDVVAKATRKSAFSISPGIDPGSVELPYKMI